MGAAVTRPFPYIERKEKMDFVENGNRWTLKFFLKESGRDFLKENKLLWVEEKGENPICIWCEDGILYAVLKMNGTDTPLTLKAEFGPETKEVELVWLGFRTELWTDGKLRDEEWPVGDCLESKEPIIHSAETVEKKEWFDFIQKKKTEPVIINKIQYWAPELGKNNVGDCMPFSDQGIYHLFYLKDRHQHQSKWGKGAHQFAHISSTDLIHWQEHPLAVEITHQWEGSICTGSVIRADDTYYIFYAVRMMDGSSAKISWATSRDCIHFVKSEQYFTLTAPYETTSVRDPEVFLGKDGKYHMLVTTNWEMAEPVERNGCLAHLVSDDLRNWEQKEPFLIPGYTDQPECCDYFEWNGWYYLIFSNYGTAKYRYSEHPFGPWLCPENEIIDGLLYRVPKTADFHGRRIAAGFLCINTEGSSYAGSLVLRELKQHGDGTLKTCFVKELTPEYNTFEKKIILDTEYLGGYCDRKIRDGGDHLHAVIRSNNNSGSFGITFGVPGKQTYEIRFAPALKTVGVYPEHSNLYYFPTKRILLGVDGLKGECRLEIILADDILDICVNEERTLVCRLEEKQTGEQNIKWGCFVKDCRAEFEVK